MVTAVFAAFGVATRGERLVTPVSDPRDDTGAPLVPEHAGTSPFAGAEDDDPQAHMAAEGWRDGVPAGQVPGRLPGRGEPALAAPGPGVRRVDRRRRAREPGQRPQPVGEGRRRGRRRPRLRRRRGRGRQHRDRPVAGRARPRARRVRPPGAGARVLRDLRAAHRVPGVGLEVAQVHRVEPARVPHARVGVPRRRLRQHRGLGHRQARRARPAEAAARLRGGDVRTAQQRLAAHGFDPGAADGVFGRRTEDATKRFQRARGLTADGIIGALTWAKLLAAK
ncbi:peptidoglycan-binding protein [Actinokineospora soli]|uniref:Peptidoglycan-binding protein n=1 Tax=Actinokineospora soli TaxID=1048753 RepID=A0ABW2TPX4_9PSEU